MCFIMAMKWCQLPTMDILVEGSVRFFYLDLELARQYLFNICFVFHRQYWQIDSFVVADRRSPARGGRFRRAVANHLQFDGALTYKSSFCISFLVKQLRLDLNVTFREVWTKSIFYWGCAARYIAFKKRSQWQFDHTRL